MATFQFFRYCKTDPNKQNRQELPGSKGSKIAIQLKFRRLEVLRSPVCGVTFLMVETKTDRNSLREEIWFRA